MSSLTVRPIRSLKGSITLPASKSYSIRAHFIAACSDQPSTIIGASDCDDALVAQRIGGDLKRKADTFDVGESGTSLRFLLPLLSFLNKPAVVNGKGTLIGRPNKHLCETLRRQGMDIQGTGPNESVPIMYKGGVLKGGDIEIDGSVSSQFVSALIIAASRLKCNTVIRTTGREVSLEYIDMTIKVLELAGIHVEKKPREYRISGGQAFKAFNFRIPSDYGLAAFPMAAAAILDSDITLHGYFNDDFIQSDAHIIGYLQNMGVKIERTNEAIKMRGPFDLRGRPHSLLYAPDLVPVMSVLALFAKNTTDLMNIGHARVKESDRISDLRSELIKVTDEKYVKEDPGALHIQFKNIEEYKKGAILDPHNDHRLAMAFTVLGLKIGCTVENIECTAKSYPAFVKDMKMLGML